MFCKLRPVSYAWTHNRAVVPVWAESVVLLAEYEYCLCQPFANTSVVVSALTLLAGFQLFRSLGMLQTQIRMQPTNTWSKRSTGLTWLICTWLSPEHLGQRTQQGSSKIRIWGLSGSFSMAPSWQQVGQIVFTCVTYFTVRL